MKLVSQKLRKCNSKWEGRGRVPRHYHKEVIEMAKKVEGYIKLQIPAGKATPAPPVGPALGQHGVNIVDSLQRNSTQEQLIREI